MANAEHLSIIRKGATSWNEWRELNQGVRPDLAGANLAGADLIGADLTDANLTDADLTEAYQTNACLIRANLSGANLSRAYLSGADLSGADLIATNLTEAYLTGADLITADLSGADLTRATLNRADLTDANLTDANLTDASLNRAQLVETNIEQASFSKAYVYGVAAWNLRGEPKDQADLVITPHSEPAVTVDDLKVAQFIHLLLSNPTIRDVIDTITSKVVLILGRFTKERNKVLDALRDELRHHNLTPVLFDFDVPDDRDITETVTLLARMARFIVADLTDPSSIPMELQAIAPDVAVPIRAIIHKDQEPFSMFRTLKKYPWVLPPHKYGDLDELLANLDEAVIGPAEAKRTELSGADST